MECEADQLSCFISLTTKDGKLVDTKGCLDEGAPQVTEMRGCIHISGPDGINGEYCFCDYDECNSHRCNSEFCSCAFSDPMHCKNITEGIKVLVLVKNYYIQWFIAIQDPTSNVELVLVQVAKMGKMLN